MLFFIKVKSTYKRKNKEEREETVMKTLSKTIKGLVAWTLAIMIVIVMAVPTWATTNSPGTGDLVELTENSTTTIVVGTSGNEANKNDMIGLYKVIKTTFNKQSNTLTHEFTDTFKAFMEQSNTYQNITTSTYFGYENDSDELKAILGEFAAYVKAEETQADKTANTGEEGVATFTEVELGQYIVVGLGSSTGAKIYQTVSVEVQPTIDNGSYKLYPQYTVNMKTSTPLIEKEVTVPSNNNSVSIGDTVTYTVKVGVPTYPAGATNKTFYMGDKMSDGLTFDENSLTVHVNSVDGTELEKDTHYTIIKNKNTKKVTFYVEFNYDKVVEEQATELYIVYNAYINENAKIGTDGITNEAKLYYSSDPFDGATWEPGHDGETANGDASDTETIYTYGLAIKKYDTENESNVLENATFEVYKASQVENGAVKDGEKPIATITTDSTGYIALNGLAKGTYYLKETKAPTGYNLLTTLVKVDLTNPTSAITTTNNYKYTSNKEQAIMDVQAQRIAQSGEVEYAWLQGDSTEVTWAATKPGDNYVEAYLLSTETTVSDTETGVAAYQIANVENSTGAQLPSTGGAGRQAFYIAGPILMVGAGVILVTRKRMERKDS